MLSTFSGSSKIFFKCPQFTNGNQLNWLPLRQESGGTKVFHFNCQSTPGNSACKWLSPTIHNSKWIEAFVTVTLTTSDALPPPLLESMFTFYKNMVTAEFTFVGALGQAEI